MGTPGRILTGGRASAFTFRSEIKGHERTTVGMFWDVAVSSMGLLVCLAFLVGAGAARCLAQDGLPSIRELEKKAVEYRSKFIDEGHVVLRVLDLPAHPQKAEFEYHTWFSGDRLRFDWRGRHLGKKKWGRFDRLAFLEDSYIHFAPGCAVVRASLSREPSYREASHAFHPGGLGMSIAGMKTLHMPQESVESVLNHSDMELVSVDRDTVGDYEAWRILKRYKNGAEVTVWLAPKCGHSIVRAESASIISGGRAAASILCEMKQYSDGDVWYPSRVEQKNTYDGRIINQHTITTVEAYFGELKDDRPFTLAGFELEAGKEVLDRRTGLQMGFRWDGEAAVPIRRRDGVTGER